MATFVTPKIANACVLRMVRPAKKRNIAKKKNARVNFLIDKVTFKNIFLGMKLFVIYSF